MNILYVEDNVVDYFIAKQNLEENYTLDWVMDGQQALDKLNQDHCYDLILLDLNMPVMNGHDFLKHYHGHFKDHLDVYIISSSTSQKDIDACREYSFVRNYFYKPLIPRMLTEIFTK